jgi:hypothetical protein
LLSFSFTISLYTTQMGSISRTEKVHSDMAWGTFTHYIFEYFAAVLAAFNLLSSYNHSEYKGFWRWYITLRITRFMDFVLRSEFEITRKDNVSETESVSVIRWGERELLCWVL